MKARNGRIREYVVKKNSAICESVDSMLKAGGITIKYRDVRRKGILPVKSPEWFKEEAEIFIPFYEIKRIEIFLQEDFHNAGLDWLTEDKDCYYIRGVKKIEVSLSFYNYLTNSEGISFHPGKVTDTIFWLDVIDDDLSYALTLIYMYHRDRFPKNHYQKKAEEEGNNI